MWRLLLGMSAQAETPIDGAAAWAELETVLRETYIYLPDAGLDADALLKQQRAPMAAIEDAETFVQEARFVLRQFNDPHLNIGPYTEGDLSVMPTGSDVWATFDTDTAVVVDVRRDGAAQKLGIRPGQRIENIDGLGVVEAIEAVMRQPLATLDPDQLSYGVNLALGGKRNEERTWQIDGAEIRLPASYEYARILKNGPPLTVTREGSVGVIRFENSLGRPETVPAFRKALKSLSDVEGLVVDLRNTASGGNTGVAEPILGHVIEKKIVYQKYQLYGSKGRSHDEMPILGKTAKPRKPRVAVPVVVLAGRWTGSMGEGMTIAFDSFGIPVVGAPMADLLGAIQTVNLQESKATLEVAVGRLFHVNGSPREDYVPLHRVEPADVAADGTDPAMTEALRVLRETKSP